MALSKTGRFPSKAEILGWASFHPPFNIKHENSSKILGRFEAKFGAELATKTAKFGELSFCNFSDLSRYS